MLELAIADFPGLVVDARELARAGKSYTVLTLAELRGEFPRRPLWLLLGADAFRGLPTWHRWREIFALAHVIVVARPGVAVADGMPAPLLARVARAAHDRPRRLVFDARRAPSTIRRSRRSRSPPP